MMTNLNLNEYLGTNYTEKEEKELSIAIRLLAAFNASGAPQTKEELKVWCDNALEKEKIKKERKAKARAKRLAKKNGTTELTNNQLCAILKS